MNISNKQFNVDRNGNDIMNLAENMSATINHAAFTLVYTGAINGWNY